MRLEDVFAVETNTASFRCAFSDPNVEISWFLSSIDSDKPIELSSGGNFNVSHKGVEHQMNIYNVSCRHEGLVFIKARGRDEVIDATTLHVQGE